MGEMRLRAVLCVMRLGLSGTGVVARGLDGVEDNRIRAQHRESRDEERSLATFRVAVLLVLGAQAAGWETRADAQRQIDIAAAAAAVIWSSCSLRARYLEVGAGQSGTCRGATDDGSRCQLGSCALADRGRGESPKFIFSALGRWL